MIIFLILIIYVDDILITIPEEQLIMQTKAYLYKDFTIKNMRHVRWA